MDAVASLTSHLLSIVILLPLGAAFLISCIPRSRDRSIYWSGILATIAALAVTIQTTMMANVNAPDLQFVEKYKWIPSIGAHFSFGLDGLGCTFLIITDLLAILAVLFVDRDNNRKKEIIVAVLVLLFSMHGVFLANDLLVFSLFYCLCPFPALFMIFSSTKSRRSSHTMPFFIYNMIASLLIIVGILAIHIAISQSIGVYTFDLPKILLSGIPLLSQSWIFWLLLGGFAIRMGFFPFHGWVIDVSEETAFPVNMILIAGFLKVGIFGMLRILLPLFPDALIHHTAILVYFALVSTIFAALTALVQENYNKLLAYSTVHQVGLIAAGIFLANKPSLYGAIILTISHSLILAILFVLLNFLYTRIPSVLFLEFGGMIRTIPFFAAGFLVISLSYSGLPCLGGFPGILHLVLGAVAANPIWAFIILAGLLLGSIYSIQLYLRLFTGNESSMVKKAEFSGTPSLWLKLAPFILIALLLGIFPQSLLDITQTSISKIESVYQSRRMLLQAGQSTKTQPGISGVSPVLPKRQDGK